MGKKILVIDAHPDRAPGRLVHALATKYANAAEAGGHLVQAVKLCELNFHGCAARPNSPPVHREQLAHSKSTSDGRIMS